MSKSKLESLEANYEVVAEDLEILVKGEKMVKDNDHYVNEDESVILKSTNLTGKIIKKTQQKNATT